MRNTMMMKILFVAAAWGAISAQASAASGHVYVSAAVAIAGGKIAGGAGFDNYVQGAERAAMDVCAAQNLPNCLLRVTSEPDGCIAVAYGSERNDTGLYTGKASDLLEAQEIAMSRCQVWNDSENCHPYISACAGDH